MKSDKICLSTPLVERETEMSTIKSYLRTYRTFLVVEGVLILLAVVMEIGSRIWPNDLWQNDLWRIGLIFTGALVVSTLIVHILALITHRFVAKRFKSKFMFTSHLIIIAGLLYWLSTGFSGEVWEMTEISTFVCLLILFIGASMSNFMFPVQDPLDSSPQ